MGGYFENDTIDCAGAAYGLAGAHSLFCSSSVNLIFSPVRPVDGGSEAQAVSSSRRNIVIIQNRISSLNDCYSDITQLGESVGHNQPTGTSTNYDKVIM